jgi:hypothetical protein
MSENCEHEWITPQLNLSEMWDLRKCAKCGLNGKVLKCKVCNEYTIHSFFDAEDKCENGRTITVTTWKCTICGNLKTTAQVWGSKPGWSMAHST